MPRYPLPGGLTELPWLPLLLLQGLRVRRATPRLPEAEGERHGRIGRGPPLRLLVLGDSAAAGVGAATQDDALAGQLVQRLVPHFRVDWQLLAHTGDSTRTVLSRVVALPDLRCDVVVTSTGVNDVTSLRAPRDFRVDQQRLVSHLREHCGARLVLVSGLPPIGQFPALPQPLRWRLGLHARRLDTALARWLATQPDCEHLPFGDLPQASMMATDGFHPGPAIYSLWAETVAQRILARWRA